MTEQDDSPSQFQEIEPNNTTNTTNTINTTGEEKDVANTNENLNKNPTDDVNNENENNNDEKIDGEVDSEELNEQIVSRKNLENSSNEGEDDTINKVNDVDKVIEIETLATTNDREATDETNITDGAKVTDETDLIVATNVTNDVNAEANVTGETNITNGTSVTDESNLIVATNVTNDVNVEANVTGETNDTDETNGTVHTNGTSDTNATDETNGEINTETVKEQESTIAEESKELKLENNNISDNDIQLSHEVSERIVDENHNNNNDNDVVSIKSETTGIDTNLKIDSMSDIDDAYDNKKNGTDIKNETNDNVSDIDDIDSFLNELEPKKEISLEEELLQFTNNINKSPSLSSLISDDDSNDKKTTNQNGFDVNKEALKLESDYLTRQIQEGRDGQHYLKSKLAEKERDLAIAENKIKDLQIRLIRFAKDDEAKDKRVAGMEQELKEINKQIEDIMEQRQTVATSNTEVLPTVNKTKEQKEISKLCIIL